MLYFLGLGKLFSKFKKKRVHYTENQNKFASKYQFLKFLFENILLFHKIYVNLRIDLRNEKDHFER